MQREASFDMRAAASEMSRGRTSSGSGSGGGSVGTWGAEGLDRVMQLRAGREVGIAMMRFMARATGGCRRRPRISADQDMGSAALLRSYLVS